MEQAFDYCREQARTSDPDRFRAALFAPPDARDALCALAAFNLEITRSVRRVSEPMLGEIRLQWWREAIDEIYGGGVLRAHPVVEALGACVKRHDLPRLLFDQVLEGYGGELAGEANIEALAEATGGSLNELALRLLLAEPNAGEIAVVRAVGRACYALDWRGPDALLHAGQALSDARRHPIRRRAMPVMLLAVLADYRLRQLTRSGDKVCRTAPGAGMTIRLLWCALRGRI